MHILTNPLLQCYKALSLSFDPKLNCKIALLFLLHQRPYTPEKRKHWPSAPATVHQTNFNSLQFGIGVSIQPVPSNVLDKGLTSPIRFGTILHVAFRLKGSGLANAAEHITLHGAWPLPVAHILIYGARGSIAQTPIRKIVIGFCWK